MLPTPNAFLQKLLVPNPQPLPTPAVPSIQPGSAKQSGQQNPFMIALNPESSEFMGHYGVNRPLRQPMFLGYRENKALYGGSKLFILY
jgi:hypothetical protein